MDRNIIRGSGIASGTDTYTVTLSVGDSAYVSNGIYFIAFTNANTITAPTLNVNSLGAKTIKLRDGSALSVGDISAGGSYILKYDGTDFLFIGGIIELKNIISPQTQLYADVTVDAKGRVTALGSQFNVSGPSSGEILTWNGSKWVNGPSTSVLPSGTTNQTLRFDGSNNIVATSFLYNTDSEVSIGTTTPISGAELSVVEEGQAGIQMAIPNNPSASPSAGGLLPNQDNYYVITAIDFFGNETAISSEVNATTTPGNNTVDVDWDDVPGAESYRIYHGTSSGAQDGYYTSTTSDYSHTASAGKTLSSLPTGHNAAIVMLNSASGHVFNGTIVYRDGNQASGKALVSDSSGIASWQPYSTISPYVVGSGSDSVELISDGTNDAAADVSAVLSGRNNSIDSGSDGSVILGGYQHQIGPDLVSGSHGYATVFGGAYGVADRWGVSVYSGGTGFGSLAGSAQRCEMLFSEQTIDATTTTMTPPNTSGSTYLYLADDSILTFTIHLTAVQTGGGAGTVGDSFSRVISGAIKSIGVSTSLVGSLSTLHSTSDAGASGWNFQVDAFMGTKDYLRLRVTGEMNKNITWVAVVYFVETRF